MLAIDLIKDDVPPIKPYESLEKALNWMDEFRVSHLPVVDQDKYYGLVSDSLIYDSNQPNLQVAELNLTLHRPFVLEHFHFYRVIQLLVEHKLSVVPILDSNEKYLGVTTISYLMNFLTNASSFSEPGSVIVLEMNQHDYSLSQISQIVESNDAQILSNYITSVKDSKVLEVTIKVNRKNIEPILQTFFRYDYSVKASFSEDDFELDMKNRYEGLMKYLNI
ncbi:MAG: CBS domain-containing protein [Parvicellaceae bacterium]